MTSGTTRYGRDHATLLAMKKFVALAFLLSVCAVPAFAKWHWHHQPKPSHPAAVHPQNPYLKHPQKHKAHPVPKNHQVK
jgi:hypothetical protein